MENSWPVGKTMNVFPVECVSLYVYRHMYEHVHICMYAYSQIHNHTYVCMYTCIHTNRYTCMCTYSHTHTHPTPSVPFVLFSFRLCTSSDLNLFFLADHSSVLSSLGVWPQGWQRDAPKAPLLLGIAKGQAQQVTARAPSITWFWLLFPRLMFSVLSLPCPLTLTKNFSQSEVVPLNTAYLFPNPSV